MKLLKLLFLNGLLMVTALPVTANEDVLHIYSSRHYNTDEALYSDFTKETGIAIQRVDGKGDALIARLEQEGEASPADLLITVDAGRLWRAEQAGLFANTQSDILESRVPENLREPNGQWFGLSKRARVIVYDKNKVDENTIQTYEDLIKPEFKNRICIRTSSNIYNLSLMASMIAMHGEDEAKKWAEGLQANLARKPQGGDTDQIKAVAAGLCDIAVVNSYYFYRLQKSNNPEDNDVISDLALVYPNQSTTGTHVNISGAGILKHSDNKQAAVKFLEYLTSDSAQQYFSDGNNEYPVVTNMNDKDKSFKAQDVNVKAFGENQTKAMMVFDLIQFP